MNYSSKERVPPVSIAATALTVVLTATLSQRIFSKTLKNLYLKYLVKKRQNDDKDIPDAIVSDIFIYPGKFLKFELVVNFGLHGEIAMSS